MEDLQAWGEENRKLRGVEKKWWQLCAKLKLIPEEPRLQSETGVPDTVRDRALKKCKNFPALQSSIEDFTPARPKIPD